MLDGAKAGDSGKAKTVKCGELKVMDEAMRMNNTRLLRARKGKDKNGSLGTVGFSKSSGSQTKLHQSQRGGVGPQLPPEAPKRERRGNGC